MANRQKYTRGAMGHLLAHFERKKDKEGNYYKFGNQDIDLTKTHLNYNMAANDQPLPQSDFLHKRMSEAYCLNRKNVNVMMTWCVSLPQAMSNKPQDEQKRFFEETYNFLKKRYGKENVISAWVHLDETGQPHVHFAYTPVVYDDKNQRYSFNAKICGSKKDLLTFHRDLDKHLTQQLGYETGVITGETEINLTIKELKELTKRQQVLEQKIERNIEPVQLPKAVLGHVKVADAEKLAEENKLLREALTVTNEQNALLQRQIKLLQTDKDYKKRKVLEKQYEALQREYSRFKGIVEKFIRSIGAVRQFQEFSQLVPDRKMNIKESMQHAARIQEYNAKYHTDVHLKDFAIKKDEPVR